LLSFLVFCILKKIIILMCASFFCSGFSINIGILFCFCFFDGACVCVVTTMNYIFTSFGLVK
jgi:hypothetical protein